MADYTPAKGQPSALSFTADAAIAAGQLVAILANGNVAPAAAAAGYLGVAGADAAAGELVTVLCGGGVIHEHNTAAAVAPPTLVTVGAGGTVQAGTAADAIGVAVRASALAAAGPPATPAVPLKWLAFR